MATKVDEACARHENLVWVASTTTLLVLNFSGLYFTFFAIVKWKSRKYILAKLNTHIENSNQLGFCPSEFIFRNIRLHLSNWASEVKQTWQSWKNALEIHFGSNVFFACVVALAYKSCTMVLCIYQEMIYCANLNLPIKSDRVALTGMINKPGLISKSFDVTFPPGI